LVSLLDEGSLTLCEADLAEAVLASLDLSQTRSAAPLETGIDSDRELFRRVPVARARRARAIAVDTCEGARALRAQASQQQRRARRAIGRHA
jgi:hypothetical protein